MITDQFDTVTELSFTQLRLDAKVDATEFTFDVPEGAEVIRPEGL